MLFRARHPRGNVSCLSTRNLQISEIPKSMEASACRMPKSGRHQHTTLSILRLGGDGGATRVWVRTLLKMRARLSGASGGDVAQAPPRKTKGPTREPSSRRGSAAPLGICLSEVSLFNPPLSATTVQQRYAAHRFVWPCRFVWCHAAYGHAPGHAQKQPPRVLGKLRCQPNLRCQPACAARLTSCKPHQLC